MGRPRKRGVGHRKGAGATLGKFCVQPTIVVGGWSRNDIGHLL